MPRFSVGAAPAPKTPIAVAAADAEAALARRRDMFAGMRRQGTGRTVEASGINLIGNQEALMNLAKEGARKDSNGFDDIDDFFGDSDGDHIPSSPLLSDLGDLGAPSPLSSDLDSDSDDGEAELEDNIVASAVKKTPSAVSRKSYASLATPKTPATPLTPGSPTTPMSPSTPMSIPTEIAPTEFDDATSVNQSPPLPPSVSSRGRVSLAPSVTTSIPEPPEFDTEIEVPVTLPRKAGRPPKNSKTPASTASKTEKTTKIQKPVIDDNSTVDSESDSEVPVKPSGADKSASGRARSQAGAWWLPSSQSASSETAPAKAAEAKTRTVRPPVPPPPSLGKPLRSALRKSDVEPTVELSNAKKRVSMGGQQQRLIPSNDQDEVEFDQDNSGWTGPDENEIDDEPAPIKQSKDKKSLAAKRKQSENVEPTPVKPAAPKVIDPRSFVVVPNSAERYPKRQRFEKMMWWRGERVTYGRDKGDDLDMDLPPNALRIGKELPVPVYKEDPFPSAKKTKRVVVAHKRPAAKVKREPAEHAAPLGFDAADAELIAEARRAAAEDVSVDDLPQDVVVQLDDEEEPHMAATYRGAVLDTRLANYHDGERPTNPKTFPRAAKVLHNERFGTGVFELPPGGFKREEVNEAAHEVYFVQQAEKDSVEVTMAGQVFTISKGAFLHVPPGAAFKLRNLSSDRAARLVFFLVMG